MRKMIFKAILLITLSVSMIAGFLVLSSSRSVGNIIAGVTGSVDYIDKGSEEVIPRLERVREKNNSRCLIVGDSVANQIFDDMHDDVGTYTIATTNQALSLAGQYILIEEFIKNHPNATDVYVGMIPSSFESEINEVYSYQYLVIPFTESDVMGLLDNDTLGRFDKIFGRFFMQKSIVRIIERSGLNRKLYLNWLCDCKEKGQIKEVQGRYSILSETSIIYINKINSLCNDNGVRLHFLTEPIADTAKNHDIVLSLERDIEDSGLSEVLGDYTKYVSFYPENQFRDGIHFKNDVITNDKKNRLICEMQNEKGVVGNLPQYQ